LITVLKSRAAAGSASEAAILDIIEILFSDTVKARYIDKELSNRYVPRGNRRKVRSQLAIYDYIKSLEQPD
jgi:polyphosphate kinase